MALTPNLNLHIYDKDSKPTYLVDHNNDMTAIDQGYAALKLSTDTASSNVAGLTTQVNTVQQLAESASALATQANENSSHASADASAAVAAANNANTNANKAVEATEGLINIDDIVVTPASGWSGPNPTFSVMNGVLVGCCQYTRSDPSTFSFDINYNIEPSQSLGFLMTNDGGEIAFRDAVPNVVTASTRNTIAFLLFSVAWDPTWTKKTDS